MSSVVNNLYEFGSFRFDPETEILWREDNVISVSPKALAVLKLLLERNGELVSKQEIFDSVWADTFVEDGVLTQNIYSLRKALGPDEDGKQFIETVARRGYRFAGQIKSILANEKTSADNGSRPITAHLDESHFAEPAAQTRRFSLPTFTVILVGLILSALGFAVYKFSFGSEKINTAKIAPIEQLRLQRLTDSGDVIYPTISPNGELLAYVRLQDQNSAIWVKQIANGSSVQTLPYSKKGYKSLVFSPNGGYLYFREEGSVGPIFQVPVLGGTPKPVADNVGSDFSLSPDGGRLAFVRREAEKNAETLVISSVDGSGEREIISRRQPARFVGSPAWSPDGGKIAIGFGIEMDFKLFAFDLATGQETELNTPKWRAVARILWMPDGSSLVFSARKTDEPSSQLWMLDYTGGEIRRLTNDLESYFWLSVSADGRMLVTRQQEFVSHLWLFLEGDAQKAKQLTFGERNLDGYVGLMWTPDGKIVFSARNGDVTDLYQIRPDGSERIQLTVNAGKDNIWPTVSSDGRYIVFTSNRTGATQAWRMDADGRVRVKSCGNRFSHPCLPKVLNPVF
ncbi:MAG: winged helix-turn-helix domain-containing protein [Pyrinomonadaceae bacterium]